MANLANTRWCKKKLKKWLKPWHMGTHPRVLSEGYPMNTNMTGFRWCIGRVNPMHLNLYSDQKSYYFGDFFPTKVLFREYIWGKMPWFLPKLFQKYHKFRWHLTWRTPGMNRLTLMVLVAKLACTKYHKNPGKSLKPWHMGTHLRVLREGYQMSTNMTGFRWFSKIFVFLCFGRK